MAATIILRPVANLVKFTSSNVVHPTFFPYPVIPSIHFARVSLAFRANAKRSGSKLSWGAEAAGYLIMCWGGSLWSHLLLGLPAPQLLSPGPWINPLAIHIFLSLLFVFVPTPSAKALDTVLPLLDALTRSTTSIAGVELVRNHSNPAVSKSLWAQVIIGGISAAGGGVTASTLGVWEQDWKLRTPPFLKPVGIFGSLDALAGIISALIYGVFAVSHPSYSQLHQWAGFSGKPLFTTLAARSLAVIFLACLYASRTLVVHWINSGHQKVDRQDVANRRTVGTIDATRKTQ